MAAPSDSETASAGASAAPLAYAGIWLAVIAWGGSYVAARLLLSAATPERVALSPTVLAALRFSIASLFFVVPLGRAILRRRISAGDLVRMAVLGQIAFSLYYWLQYTGVQHTNASISSILIVGLIPVATAFLAQFLGNERLTPARFAALLLGLAGVAVIVLRQQLAVSQDAGFLFGALCLVADAFAFAVYVNLSKRWMRTVSPLIMTGGTMVSGTVGLLLLSFTDPAHNRWRDVALLDTRQWLALLFLVLVCSVAAYFVYNVALTRVNASRATVYIYVEPVVAVVLGITLLGERLNAATLLGTALIAASVVMVTRIQR